MEVIYGNALQYIAAPHLTESVSRQVNRNAQNSAEPAFHMLTLNFWWVSGRSAIIIFTVRRDRPCAGWGDAARPCEPTWFHVNGGRTPTDHEQNCLDHVDCKHSSTQEFYSGRNFATLSIETWSICTIFLLDELECPRYIGFHFMNLSPGHRMWWRGRRPHTMGMWISCEIITVLCFVQSC